MKKLLPIVVMFSIGLGFLAGGWWWIAPAMTTFRDGERHPARIAGMLRLREEGADLITGLHSEIGLVCKNGDQVEVVMQDFKVVDLRVSGGEAEGGPSEVLAARFRDEEGTALLARIARGNVDEITRILRREGRQNRDDGIVGLRKRELATGWFGLGRRPTALSWDGQGVVLPDFAPGEESPGVSNRIVSSVRFGTYAVDTGEGRRKLTEPRFTREVLHPAGLAEIDDFVMFDGGHGTEYRPILTYMDGGEPMVILADLGKIKGESSAFRLFSSAYVYTAGRDQPLMVADLEALGAKASLLSWFSSASEAVFSRWVYPAFFWSFGLYTLVFACIAVSLYIKPGKRMNGGG